MSNNKMIDLYPLIIEAFENDLKFKFPVNGKSMRPLLKSGDNVTLDKPINLKVGDMVLYKRENGQFVLHRIKKIKNDSFNIVGDHQVNIEKNINYNQMIAKVISYSKHGEEKEHYLNNFKYKIYKFFVKFRIVRYLNSHLS